MAKKDQNTVLIVGGAGFLGHYLTTHFLSSPAFGPSNVHILSRSAPSSSSLLKKANYISGDVTNHAQIRSAIGEIKPTVIINTASPSPVTGTKGEYHRVNVLGTRNLLKCAKQSPSVRAFILTSSSTIAVGKEHRNLDEASELASRYTSSTAYARSKADAETMVLSANYPKHAEDINGDEENVWEGYISTATIRLPIVYGTRDTTLIPGCLTALADNQTNVIVGNGENLWSYCSASNAATAHVLLATALLKPPSGTTPKEERVDGEPFHINDGTPYPFWSFPRLVWKTAGYDPQPFPKTTHIPAFLALLIADILEWTYWIFTLGFKRPYKFGRQQVEIMCFTHTYSIEKATRRLGYEPRGDLEGEVEKGTRWCLEELGWRERLSGVKGTKMN